MRLYCVRKGIDFFACFLHIIFVEKSGMKCGSMFTGNYYIYGLYSLGK